MTTKFISDKLRQILLTDLNQLYITHGILVLILVSVKLINIIIYNYDFKWFKKFLSCLVYMMSKSEWLHIIIRMTTSDMRTCNKFWLAKYKHDASIDSLSILLLKQLGATNIRWGIIKYSWGTVYSVHCTLYTPGPGQSVAKT